MVSFSGQGWCCFTFPTVMWGVHSPLVLCSTRRGHWFSFGHSSRQLEMSPCGFTCCSTMLTVLDLCCGIISHLHLFCLLLTSTTNYFLYLFWELLKYSRCQYFSQFMACKFLFSICSLSFTLTTQFLNFHEVQFVGFSLERSRTWCQLMEFFSWF